MIYLFKYILFFPIIDAIVNYNNDYDPNNEIIGSPIIQCTPEKVKFSIETLRPFHGRIYVKGEFNKKKCGRSFSILDNLYDHNYQDKINNDNSFYGTSKLLMKNHNKYEYQNANDIGNEFVYDKNEPIIFSKGNSINNPRYEKYLIRSFGGTKECPIICPICDKCNCQNRNKRNTNNWNDLIIPINECFSKRDSQIETSTEAVTFTVIVSFHKNFLTKLDKSYQIICTYPEISKTVQTEINVNTPTPKDVSIIVDSPKCLYSLKDINHVLVKHVNIGDEIIHEWSCESMNTNMYAMIVKNCYVEDGSGRKELVIDERGCSLDNNVLKTPIYSPNKMKAYVKSNVFKFPDRQFIDFQCNIGICINSEQDCSNISPPKCDNSYARYKRDVNNITDIETLNIQLHSQTLTVLETKKQLNTDNEESSNLLLNLDNLELFSVQLCLSFLNYSILIASGTFTFTVLTIVHTITTIVVFNYLRLGSLSNCNFYNSLQLSCILIFLQIQIIMDAYDISQYKGRYSKLLGEFNPNSVNYNPDLLRRLKGEKEETFLTWDTFSKYFGVFFGGVVVGIVATVLIMCWWDCCCMRCLRSCTSCDRCKNYNEIEDGTEGAE